jgi:hypothetical protein
MKRIVLLLLALGVIAGMALSQEGQPARVLDRVNVRVNGDQTAAVITQLAINTDVIVEARNRVGNWVLVRTGDGSIRGWVASRYVFWRDGVPLEALPVSTEVLGVPAPAAAAPADSGASAASPQAAPIAAEAVSTEGLSPRAAELVAVLSGVPILPAITPQMREMYASNIAAGRDPHNFAKIGDCNSEFDMFLRIFSRGDYDLGPYSYLEDTIRYYSRSYDSFNRYSMAARTGHLTTTVIDPIFADNIKCPNNMSMLHCEYHQMNPALSLMMLGMNDSVLMDVNTFRAAVNQIAYDSVQQKVLPIFFTVPTTASANPLFEKTMEFNLAIVETANAYGIPVVNFWLAAQSLPGDGMAVDAIHPTSNERDAGNFTGAEKLQGFTLWNLLVLQVLDMFRLGA